MIYFKKIWQEKTLFCILVIAFISRLIAVFFAKGFGMHDDHFLVIEAAQSWVDGSDYNDWLPWSPGNTGPEGHSFFYVGIHFLLLTLIKWFQIDDPQSKMIIIRLLHALWSLLVINFGYKIVEKASDKKLAVQVGLILALFWFFPWISVRNLPEVASIPFLIWSIWLIYKNHETKEFSLDFLWAGFLFGMAFSTRFQTALFISGAGLVLLIYWQWKNLLFLVIGFIISVLLFEGIIDWVLWGKPFAEMQVYIQYNIDHSKDYIISAWYTYLLLLGGILLPPVSLFLFAGFFRSWKKYLLLFLPTFIFLVFHSFFPNKQERFILTIVPFFIITGILGWNIIISNSKFWYNRKKILQVCWYFFWILNFILMLFISTHYSKKSRVESMIYLSHYKDIKYILTENTNAYDTKLVAEFYLGQWIHTFDISKSYPLDSLKKLVNDPDNKDLLPRFFIFEETKNLENRVLKVRNYFPNIEYETTINPGFIDNLLYRLNPINANQTIIIYRNKDFYPQKMHIKL
jgi:hypothetical protein